MIRPLNSSELMSLFFGNQTIHLLSTDSTNNFAAKLLAKGLATEGAVIMADHQTGGRGQRGNVWLSESGKNLLSSFVCKPDNLSVERQVVLTWLTSLSVVETLRKFNIEARIKWPNDIFVGSKKICGILIENQLNGKCIQHAIIGIGLNVAQLEFGDFAATSVSKETGMNYAPIEILHFLRREMEKQFGQLDQISDEQIKNNYMDSLYLLNELAPFEDESGSFYGTITHVTNTGMLVVQKEKEKVMYGIKEIRYCS